MLLKIKPKAMSIYVANGKLTCAQVRQRTGCDICINGTLYNFSTMKPVCDVKINGVVMSDDQYSYWGYGWNDGQARATMSNKMSSWKNYISCVALCKDGKKVSMYYNKDVGGVRGRSAIGYMKDGTMVIYCSKDGTSAACSPESLQTQMLNYGCVDALMLDSGGSCSLESDAGRITTSRKVANYICIWVDKEDTPAEDIPQPICPYKEPTTNVKNGTRGESAKWVQWCLNVIINAGLIVDGIFGSKSVTALKSYQRSKSLTPDGICGKLTRSAIKEDLED